MINGAELDRNGSTSTANEERKPTGAGSGASSNSATNAIGGLVSTIGGGYLSDEAGNLGAITDAAAGTATAWSKLQLGLGQILVEARSFSPDAAASGEAQFSNTAAIIFDGMVAIDAVAADGNGASLLAALQMLGLQQGASFGALAGGLIPISSLSAVSNLVNLAFARPFYAITDVGLVTSQDDPAMLTDDFRLDSGLSGSGITIGVLSDSFATRTSPLTTYAQDVANGDLPAGITILQDMPTAGTDEGRGMAQQIFDVAPGVQMAYHTAFISQASFAQGIVDLSLISDIVVDDVRYFAEPMFQDGILAQAVDQAVANGAMYFSSAGNYADRSYESAFSNSGTTVTISGRTYTLHDFDPGAGVDTRLQLNQSGTVTYIFQWDQPFASAGGAGSQSDLALIFYINGTPTFISDANNINGDALEIQQLSGSTSGITFEVAFGHFQGAEPGLIKMITLGGSQTEVETYTGVRTGGTSFGHSNAEGAIAVAAAGWADTPEFGLFPLEGKPLPYAETFTSRGGVPILFDTAGVRLGAPLIRDKVEFTAPDGGNTTFFGTDVSYDADTFPNFFGTSSAAPNAAAFAALLMESYPFATIAQIEQAMKDSALDIQFLYNGTGVGVGRDDWTGEGLIQFNAAYAALAALFPARAERDELAASESGINNGSVFANNGHGADTPGGGPLAVALVNGDAGNVGSQFSLSSGALLTLDGTGAYSYSTNGQFAYLISAAKAAATGAVNTFDADSFTYTLDGGNTAVAVVTIFGTDGAGDELHGDSGDNSIIGTGAADIVIGFAGNDTLAGGAGNDTLTGGAGNDVLDGGTGADTMTGGVGNDVYYVDSADVVSELSGEGTDEVRTTRAGYVLDANVENLTGLLATGQALVGNGLANVITGGAGNDQLDGKAGADTLVGGAGNDTYYVDDAGDVVSEMGGGGTDTVRTTLASYQIGVNVENLIGTGTGGQTLLGNNAVNTITGTGAADRINGAGGNDTMAGGIGNDIYFVGQTGDVVVELAGQGYDIVYSTADYTLSSNVESLRFQGADALNGIGNALDNQLIGNAGANDLSGLDGADRLYGIGGNDTLHGGTGDDFLFGGDGADTLHGEDGADFLRGDNENDVLHGGDGADNMAGGNGNDTLHGDGDNDYMFGDAGNDTLWGGTGQDTMWGGLNTDTFAFADGDTSADAALCDRIIDFAQAQGDRLDLSAMDANTLAGGDQAFAFIGASAFAGTGAASAGELRYTFVGAYTFVQGDTDGNGTADFMIRLDGNIPFSGVDVIL